MSTKVEGDLYDVKLRCLDWALCEVNETADFDKLDEGQITLEQLSAYNDNLQIVLGVLLEVAE